MHTYFLGREEVDAYVRDLVDRLQALGELFPYTWCTLGHSGEELAVVISKALPKDGESKIRIIPMNYDRASKAVVFQDEQDKAVFADGKPVLILDSSVHTGNTMLAVFQTLKSLGAKNICSYSLVVKRNSAYIPNFFGVVIQPHDRAYFLLDKIPNNRLQVGVGQAAAWNKRRKPCRQFGRIVVKPCIFFNFQDHKDSVIEKVGLLR